MKRGTRCDLFHFSVSPVKRSLNIFSGFNNLLFWQIDDMSLSINLYFFLSYFNIFLCQDYFHHALTTFLLLCKGKITLRPDRRIQSSHSNAFLSIAWYTIIRMFLSYYVNYLYLHILFTTLIFIIFHMPFLKYMDTCSLAYTVDWAQLCKTTKVKV